MMELAQYQLHFFIMCCRKMQKYVQYDRYLYICRNYVVSDKKWCREDN